MPDDTAQRSSQRAEHDLSRRSVDVYTVDGIGAAIGRLRREAGLSQTEFGALVGASRPWISDLERGNLRGGQLDTVLSCIHALGYRIVLEDLDSKPAQFDDLKDAMRQGPLARRPLRPGTAFLAADARTQPDPAHRTLARLQPDDGGPADDGTDAASP